MTSEAEFPIPTRLNLAYLGGCTVAWLAILATAARVESVGALLACGALLAVVQIPVYSLLHEASHGLFHPDRRANELLGRWLAVLFGMSFTFYRHCHTRHHVKNRTDIELWDLYRPQDVRWKRAVNLYLMLTGAGYALVWISVLVFALAPRLAHAAPFRRHTEIAGFLEGADGAEKVRTMRWESLGVIAVYAAVYLAFGHSPATFLVPFAVHGFVWSSQNYVNHAFSKRDVIHGAHNLWMPAFLRPIYLNFNCHLAHHERPGVPWIHLPKLVPAGTVRLAFFRNWLRMWGGPRLTTEGDPRLPSDAHPAA